jgi:hypothetical protein
MKPLFSTKTPYFWLKNAAEVVPENEFSNTLHNYMSKMVHLGLGKSICNWI